MVDKKLKLGSRIKFIKTLSSEPDEFGPGNLYAVKDGLGYIVERAYLPPEGHWVIWDSWANSPFGAKINEEFTLIQNNDLESNS